MSGVWHRAQQWMDWCAAGQHEQCGGYEEEKGYRIGYCLCKCHTNEEGSKG